MKILICNAGSTSLKFKLWDMPAFAVLAGQPGVQGGLAERQAREPGEIHRVATEAIDGKLDAELLKSLDVNIERITACSRSCCRQSICCCDEHRLRSLCFIIRIAFFVRSTDNRRSTIIPFILFIIKNELYYIISITASTASSMPLGYLPPADAIKG